MTTPGRATGPFHAYVDGFNLYYGSVIDTSFKWLDLAALANEIAGEQPSILRYFSARVKSMPWNLHAHQRQDTYWQALRAVGVDIVEGQFLVQNKWKRLSQPMPGLKTSPKRAEVIISEEKGSDVNLGALLLVDAYELNLRRALVVTNDSDLAKPIELVMTLGVEVIIANPHPKPAKALLNISVGGQSPVMRRVFKQALKRSQLPNPVVDPVTGRRIGRPHDWA
ncbi:MAG TPA: NYN domain-containing protein [Acidimicrobiia bacterium]|nr:NYN domain-containing protein [Acidimicrobiia bacterium]